ncbi:hypothetical protein B0H67DRAFT_587063 [Lasiosphaeris hirsuta]|uniref:Uncharacterized protein n=1 Tax=Lasiosphaeris hirsuta TaxID=260670 RepID=A0AA40DST1_9PEZI|nr:hypothetical protein B0H67DRAFT_587063 [Lasiosphaeris hirsuta]
MGMSCANFCGAVSFTLGCVLAGFKRRWKFGARGISGRKVRVSRASGFEMRLARTKSTSEKNATHVLESWLMKLNFNMQCLASCTSLLPPLTVKVYSVLLAAPAPPDVWSRSCQGTSQQQKLHDRMWEYTAFPWTKIAVPGHGTSPSPSN